jgi:recombination protein RecR
MNFPSTLVEEAVNELSGLPGIGKKTALRLVLHLLKQDMPHVEKFGNAFIRLRKNIIYCKECHNLSDREVCDICLSDKRDPGIICVVEDVRDVMAIENTGQFHGKYHVLGGIISPMNGIGPSDLQIESLVHKVLSGRVTEVIMALSTTIEGDTTVFYVYKKLSKLIEGHLKYTVIARGVAIGDELEYADEVTLGRSILNRVPFSKS